MQISGKIRGFLTSFDSSNPFILSNLTTVSNENVPMINSSCAALITSAYYTGRNFSVIHPPINYSTLSKTEPFFEYVTIAVYNKTIAPLATNLFYSNGGFCDKKILSILISNSTYSSTKININGTPAYMLEFSNLTPSGVILAAENYTGKAPDNIDFFIVTAMYKSVEVEAADVGFFQSMNASRLILMESKILQHVKQIES